MFPGILCFIINIYMGLLLLSSSAETFNMSYVNHRHMHSSYIVQKFAQPALWFRYCLCLACLSSFHKLTVLSQMAGAVCHIVVATAVLNSALYPFCVLNGSFKCYISFVLLATIYVFTFLLILVTYNIFHFLIKGI